MIASQNRLNYWRFDERIDFELLRKVALASKARSIVLAGRINKGRKDIEMRIEELTKAHSNVVYLGDFSNANLPELLAKYSVCLAPYKVSSALTDHIDPLRFYHCLNSGLEVISTAIPRAIQLHERIHLVSTAEDVERIICRLEVDAERKNPDQNPFEQTWKQRVDQILEELNF